MASKTKSQAAEAAAGKRTKQKLGKRPKKHYFFLNLYQDARFERAARAK